MELTVQVKPSPINKMVIASAGVQTDLSQVVFFSCRPISHSSEPQSSILHISSPRARDIDALNINWSGLIAYVYPPMVLGPSAALNLILLPVSTALLKQSHKQVFHNNPQHVNLHAWCLGVDNSKNKAYLWK